MTRVVHDWDGRGDLYITIGPNTPVVRWGWRDVLAHNLAVALCLAWERAGGYVEACETVRRFGL